MSNKTQKNQRILKVIRLPRLCGNCVFKHKTKSNDIWFCSKIQQYVHEQMLACKKFHDYDPRVIKSIQVDIDRAIIARIKSNPNSSKDENSIRSILKSESDKYEIRKNIAKPKPYSKKKNKTIGRFSKLDV